MVVVVGLAVVKGGGGARGGVGGAAVGVAAAAHGGPSWGHGSHGGELCYEGVWFPFLLFLLIYANIRILWVQ